MKQSQYDPTLRDHFSEEEGRQWIRHLEKIIESLERRLKAARSKNAMFAEKVTQIRREHKRLLFRVQVLQERHPEIDFGLCEFSQEQGDG